MWSLKEEREVQLQIMALGDSTNLKDYINYTYEKLIKEPRDGISTLDKLHELLVTSLIYGDSQRDIEITCPNCGNILPITIDILECIYHEKGGELADISMSAKDFLECDEDKLKIEYDCECFCKQKIKYVAKPYDIFNHFVFYYDLITYYKMINFFKHYGYSTQEIGEMTYIEAKILKSIIDEEEARREATSTNNQDY